MAREVAAASRQALRRLAARLRGLWQREASGGEPEAPDVAAGRVVLVLAGWTLFVALTLADLGWYTLNRVKLGSPSQDVAVLPAPRLQVDPAADYDRLVKMQRERLATYAWVDRANGLVQIPIERAMAIVAAKGAAGFAPLAPSAPDEARTRAVEAARQAGAAR